MRVVSECPVLQPWLLLFLLLQSLSCHASYSGEALGLKLDQMHNEEQKPIEVGKGARGGADEDSPRGWRVQDGVDEDSPRGWRVHDGVDEDLLHETLKLRSRLNEPEGDVDVQSSRVDFPCPKAIDIEPCICSVDAEENIDLDCSAVTSEEQLALIFQKEFPIQTLRYFNMTENSYIRILDNILNEVTFQKLSLYPGPFALSAISEYFFLNCRKTLESIDIHKTNLTSVTFPFATFELMEKLSYVMIDGSSFTYIPKIIAPTVSSLNIHHALTEVLETGTFPFREETVHIYISYNQIHTVEPGTFYFVDQSSAASSWPVSLSVRANKLKTIQAGTFPLRNGATYIYLRDNQIEEIEPGTFVLPGNTTHFSFYPYLTNNLLTTFSEEIFGELMPYTVAVELYANPLACDCSLAWIITNPEHLAKIDVAAACDDGTKLVDLDPVPYIEFC